MAQIAVPTSTITTDNWYGNDNGTSLHTYIAETIASANDTDYIRIPNFDPGLNEIPAGTYTCEVKFGSLTDPTVNTGHILKIRSKRNGLSNQTINISLYQGTSLIYSSSVTATSSYANSTLTLSEAEAANITNYTDLRIRMSYVFPGGGDGPNVSAVEFEVPDAGGGGGGVVDTTTPTAFMLFL